MRTAFIIACLMLAAIPRVARADEGTQQELGALLDRIVQVLNTDDIDTLLAETTPEVAFTAMNGRVAHGRDGVRAYFDAMRGVARGVEEYHIALSPDGPATLHGDDNAIATGDAQAHYKFKGGMELDANGRWTADLVRGDGGWKIAAAHYSGNMFDNPVLHAAELAIPIAGAGAGATGLIVGFLLGRWRRRKAVA